MSLMKATSRAGLLMKRLLDVVASSLGLLCLSPLIVLIALAVKVTSSGPVLYRGVRVGLYGKPFRILKFRTMVVDAEAKGGASTPDDDPRITGIGGFLRRYKLDELPQLGNVLIGEMSLVGPRPEVQKFVDMYTEEEKIILTVKPGITDWASLWNSNQGALLAGSLDSDRDYVEKIRPEKIRLQLKYVRERTFWADLAILVKTVLAIIFR
jgi:lipopolysaccharide/colanic/teichoic acid biosynthesis glycosyltransferase